MPTELAISTADLSKRFGDKVAVDSVNFEVKRGEVFGFLGPNGAGKTTTIKMLTTLIPPSSGAASILGFDLRSQAKKVREKIGVVQQQDSFDQGLKVETSLDIYGLIWDMPADSKWALLSGLWEGDGSWSLINGGPSVILEFGTISDELADGVLRLLGDLGIVASRRIGRAARSTKDTHWIRVSGAEQIERAIELVPERDRAGVRAAIASQRKRIAPTGYRRVGAGPAWARISELRRGRHCGHVFSLEVPLSHTVVTSGGVITSNCFPKDVDALKQLAGNSGYHFQLLTAVIEVNELQKRRVIGKLHKHLDGLVGKRVALLGLAFKPNTDDMREASSLVLSARLHADGATVVAYDPIAEEQARALVPGVTFASSPLAAVEQADAVVLVTEWREFLELDWKRVAQAMSGDLVVDGRNALDPDAIRGAGLLYEGIGRQ